MRITPLIVLSSLFIGCGKPMHIDSADYTRRAQITADIHKLDAELTRYKSANGHFPPTEQGLQVLAGQGAKPPKDPWSNDYICICPGKMRPGKYDLFSAGPDHVDN